MQHNSRSDLLGLGWKLWPAEYKIVISKVKNADAVDQAGWDNDEIYVSYDTTMNLW